MGTRRGRSVVAPRTRAGGLHLGLLRPRRATGGAGAALETEAPQVAPVAGGTACPQRTPARRQLRSRRRSPPASRRSPAPPAQGSRVSFSRGTPPRPASFRTGRRLPLADRVGGAHRVRSATVSPVGSPGLGGAAGPPRVVAGCPPRGDSVPCSVRSHRGRAPPLAGRVRTPTPRRDRRSPLGGRMARVGPPRRKPRPPPRPLPRPAAGGIPPGGIAGPAPRRRFPRLEPAADQGCRRGRTGRLGRGPHPGPLSSRPVAGRGAAGNRVPGLARWGRDV